MITSNRDDHPSRATSTIIQKKIGEKMVVFPQDPLSKGTWIAMSDHNQIVVLLNGAFEKHISTPPYRASRGTMFLDFFQFVGVKDFLENYNFKGLEPFTLIIFEKSTLNEIIWDGIEIHHTILDETQNKIWASCTLYDKKIRIERKKYFLSWTQKQKDFNRNDIVHFHQFTNKDDLHNGFVINRNEKVKTLSITNITSDDNLLSLHHKDLISGKIADFNLPKVS